MTHADTVLRSRVQGRSASRPLRKLVVNVLREALAHMLRESTVIGIGLSGQVLFVCSLIAMSTRRMSTREGLVAAALSLALYGLALALGQLAALRYGNADQKRPSPRS